MLTYRSAYKSVDGGVHAQVLDFPAVISCGSSLDKARQMLASALVDIAEFYLDRGQPLPLPDPTRTDIDADLDEPIHLHLSASSAVDQVATGVVGP